MFNRLVFFLTVAVLAANLSLCEFVKTWDKSYFASKEAVNWTNAKQACRDAGLELASVLTEKEKTSLEKFIEKNKITPTDKWTGYWLSGIRHPNGTFFWDSTGTQIGEAVTNWQLGEPSNGYNREHCVELKLVDVELGWNDYFCDENRRYICQNIRKEGPHGQDLPDYRFLTENNTLGTIEYSYDDYPLIE
ncbi:salivary C-type lectin 2-like [Rhynchophorus ferrugineus]|uniref:salivary C-type lectin 2-like n=1 Tax=Rhynchophorus ferrugineus TaxID=354439 RepID=UPI003FCD05A9